MTGAARESRPTRPGPLSRETAEYEYRDRAFRDRRDPLDRDPNVFQSAIVTAEKSCRIAGITKDVNGAQAGPMPESTYTHACLRDAEAESIR
jgi:hypothetical protein